MGIIKSKQMKQIDVIGPIDAWFSNNRDNLKWELDKADGQEVVFNISSEGGSVFEGLSMAAMIADYPGKTTAKGLGIVASIATVVFLAADKRIMSKDSFFMIHNAWTITAGNKEEINKDLELLNKIDNQLAKIYLSANDKFGKTKKTEKEMRKMMENETWLTAEEAMDLGFVDSILEENTDIQNMTFARLRAQASNFKNIPNKLKIDMKEDKKSFIHALANFFGFKAEIKEVEAPENVTDEAEAKQPEETAPEIEAATEEAEKAPEVDAEVAALEAKKAELEKAIAEQTKKLEEMQAKALATKATGKTETETKDSTKYNADLINQATNFVKSIIKH